MNERSKEAEKILNERINRGHHTYKQYIQEEYGRIRAKKMMQEKSQVPHLTRLGRAGKDI